MARKKQKKEAQKKKQLTVLLVAFGCVILIALILFVSSLPAQFETEGDRVVNKGNGNAYYLAPWNYEPAYYTTKTYGRLDGHKMVTLNGDLREKEPIDPAKWLARDVYGIYEVYYSVNEILPTLAEFEADSIRICNDGVEYNKFLNEITKAEDVQAVLDAILNGEPVTIPEGGQTVANYTLRFVSSRYDWLYYKITYHVNSGGLYYYDRTTDTVYRADSLVEDYIRESVETAEITDTAEESGADSTLAVNTEASTGGGAP